MPNSLQSGFTAGGTISKTAVQISAVDLSDRLHCVLAGFGVSPLPISSASVPSVVKSVSVF